MSTPKKDCQNSLTPEERRSIASRNLGLVRSIANGYSIGSADPYTRDDLVNQGVLGLMRGIQLCSFTGGTTYSTFLGTHIHGAIRHYLRRQRHLICPSKGKPPYIIQRVTGMDDGDDLIESIAAPKSSSEEDAELLAVVWAVLEDEDEKTKLIVRNRAKGLTLEQSSAAAKCCYKTTVRKIENFKRAVIKSI